MELDQLLFKKIWKFAASLKKNKEEDNPETTVYLADIKNRLTVLARALSGRTIEVFEAQDYSCSKNNIYFLPEKYKRFDSYQQNYFYYVFRIFYLYAQQDLDIKATLPDDAALAVRLQKSADNAPIVIEKLRSEFPVLIEQFEEIFPTLYASEEEKKRLTNEWLGKWLNNDDTAQTSAADKKVNQWEQLNELERESVELNAKTKDNIEILEVDKEKQEQYVLTHNFEKIETLDDFNGNWRDFDDDENLDESREALEELDMNQMVRVDSPSHSVYHAEFFNSKGIKEAKQNADAPVTKKMDEWDYQQKKYKKNFCQLYESQHSETSTAYTEQTFTKHKTVLHRLDRKLNNFFNDYQKVRQQQDGEELDLDAVTDRFADIHAGHTPNDNIFLSKRKKIKDLAILILTDISLSTDGYVSGYKIIDTEKQSLLLFGEILSKQGTNFQLDTFSSRTRNYCEYQSIKRFDEDWTAYKHKVGAITPKGYTRIGAAIRNAHEHLKKTDSRKKWLLLLTDGKPNDYDRYEGKYGIEDVKQAVQEVRKNNIYISALAIDSNAKFYLPQMLGKDAFRLVHRPNLLPDALIDFYLKVAR